jgi:lysozyme
MQLSEEGLQLLRELEGVEREPYQDSVGLWTIGCGHLITKDEWSSGKIQCGDRVIRWKDGPLTDEEIDALLEEDASWAEAAVTACVHTPLTQHQFDALVLLCYNIGPNALRNSTLVTKLNRGLYDEIPVEFARWNRAGGRVLQGLVNRRAREIALWDTDTGFTRA